MKKTLLFCVCLMALLCSCSKDDGDGIEISTTTIAGKWVGVRTQYVSKETGEVFSDSEIENDYKELSTYVFYDDGTCTSGTSKSTGKYKLGGDQLVVNIHSETRYYTIKELTKTKLVLQRERTWFYEVNGERPKAIQTTYYEKG